MRRARRPVTVPPRVTPAYLLDALCGRAYAPSILPRSESTYETPDRTVPRVGAHLLAGRTGEGRPQRRPLSAGSHKAKANSDKPRKNRCGTCPRDSHGRTKRSPETRREFMRQTGYAHGRKGYVIDHIKPRVRRCRLAFQHAMADHRGGEGERQDGSAMPLTA